MPPPPPPPMPTLPEELLEEIFIRLPPDEPEWVVRASLASKLWLGLLTDPAFRGRYREFHGAAPMFGFFYCWPPRSIKLEKEDEPLIHSTTKFRARISEHQGLRSHGCNALDCRHGRVVLGDNRAPLPRHHEIQTEKLVVSHPMTGCWGDLGTPLFFVHSYGVVVLYTATGCDHRACREGPFRVVFVALDKKDGGCDVYECVSLPGTGERSKPCSDLHLNQKWNRTCHGLDHLADDAWIEPVPPVLIESTLHFILVYNDDDDGRAEILKYDLCSNSLSVIDAPLDEVDTPDAIILMAMEDGSLGFAYEDGLTLYLWSRQLGSDRVASWTKCKVINLREFLPIQNPGKRLRLIGSVEGSDIIFVTTDLGIYEINLKTLRWNKLWKREKLCTLMPYMSCYNPQERVRPYEATH